MRRGRKEKEKEGERNAATPKPNLEKKGAREDANKPREQCGGEKKERDILALEPGIRGKGGREDENTSTGLLGRIFWVPYKCIPW